MTPWVSHPQKALNALTQPGTAKCEGGNPKGLLLSLIRTNAALALFKWTGLPSRLRPCHNVRQPPVVLVNADAVILPD